MEDIMGKIGQLLSDEESVKQLSEIAQMFMSEAAAASPDDGAANKNEEHTDSISENSDESSASPSGTFDFSSLMKLQGLMGAFGKSDKNTELLLALKPHLKEEKQIKVDKAVKLLRLLAVFNVMKESGMLKDFL